MENEEKGLVDKELLDQASYVLGGIQTGIEQADELQEQQVAEDATIQAEQESGRNFKIIEIHKFLPFKIIKNCFRA